jgi:hypothetical protein
MRRPKIRDLMRRPRTKQNCPGKTNKPRGRPGKAYQKCMQTIYKSWKRKQTEASVKMRFRDHVLAHFLAFIGRSRSHRGMGKEVLFRNATAVFALSFEYGPNAKVKEMHLKAFPLHYVYHIYKLKIKSYSLL